MRAHWPAAALGSTPVPILYTSIRGQFDPGEPGLRWVWAILPGPALFDLCFDDDLKRVRLRGARKGIVCIQNLLQLEVMRDQLVRLELARLHGLEQHRRRYRVHKPRRDANVLGRK